MNSAFNTLCVSVMGVSKIPKTAASNSTKKDEPTVKNRIIRLSSSVLAELTQRTNDVYTTSHLRRLNAMTLYKRDVPDGHGRFPTSLQMQGEFQTFWSQCKTTERINIETLFTVLNFKLNQ